VGGKGVDRGSESVFQVEEGVSMVRVGGKNMGYHAVAGQTMKIYLGANEKV